MENHIELILVVCCAATAVSLIIHIWSYFKKPDNLQEALLREIASRHNLPLEEIAYIYNECRSIDRTIDILEYKAEYNLSVESAINLLR